MKLAMIDRSIWSLMELTTTTSNEKLKVHYIRQLIEFSERRKRLTVPAAGAR